MPERKLIRFYKIHYIDEMNLFVKMCAFTKNDDSSDMIVNYIDDCRK